MPTVGHKGGAVSYERGTPVLIQSQKQTRRGSRGARIVSLQSDESRDHNANIRAGGGCIGGGGREVEVFHGQIYSQPTRGVFRTTQSDRRPRGVSHARTPSAAQGFPGLGLRV